MRRIARLLALIVTTSAVLIGAVVGLSVVVAGIGNNGASAQAISLPPLSSQLSIGSTVYADDGHTVLATYQGSVVRRPVQLSAVAPIAIKAVLDTEDERFYLHGGFDIPSTVRALASDSSRSGGLQGGSTIAQQLVKNTYVGNQRTLARKIKEAVLADRLEKQYSKNQILDAYLNTIYLGSSAYGVEAAANIYFNEPASALTLPQGALLAGLIQDPSGHDPIADPSGATQRRSEVLARMVHYGDITPAQAAAANATPLPGSVQLPPSTPAGIPGYYTNAVKNQLLAANTPDTPTFLGATYKDRVSALFTGGLKIYTNYDPTEQAEAQATTAADTPANTRGYVEALVSIDPTTGRVKAMVGGNGADNAQYNVVTEGLRQPGSGFKLFTLLATLEAGGSPYDTVNASAPCAIAFPGNNGFLPPHKPATNDEGAGGGVVPLITATAQSLNCGFIRMGHEVGLPAIAAMAHRMGITNSLNLVPSMILGADEVHPLDIASSYAAVADGGVYHTPSFIDHVVDREGRTIYQGVDYTGHRVISTQIAEEATLCLQAVVTSGTGYAAALAGRPAAGKTGTTSNTTDAWFNGFVPQLETTVWMGATSGDPSVIIHGVGVYGGTYPARTWHDYMTKALAGNPVVPFTPPDPAEILPAHFIDSPSLERDDHTAGRVAGLLGANGYPTYTPYTPTSVATSATTLP